MEKEQPKFNGMFGDGTSQYSVTTLFQMALDFLTQDELSTKLPHVFLFPTLGVPFYSTVALGIPGKISSPLRLIIKRNSNSFYFSDIKLECGEEIKKEARKTIKLKKKNNPKYMDSSVCPCH